MVKVTYDAPTRKEPQTYKGYKIEDNLTHWWIVELYKSATSVRNAREIIDKVKK